MPLTADKIVRSNSGGVSAATSGAAVAVSLAGSDSTEAGNTLIVFLAGGNGQAFSVTPPSGWVNIDGTLNASDASVRLYARGPGQGLAAGETTWNFTPSIASPAGPVRWTVWEIEGVWSGSTWAEIQDANSGSPLIQTSGTTAVDTTGITSTYDGLAISVHVSYNPSGTDSWGSHTGGFVEVVEGSQSNGGTGNVTLSISALPVNTIGTYGATATCSRTLNSTNAGLAYTTVINAAGARKAANITYMDGAEHGTITGNTVGDVTSAHLLESVTGSVSVSSSAARSGNYGWLFSSSAAACNWVFGTTGAGAANGGTITRHFRFPTLPGADLEFWATSTVRVRFINSSSKIGMQVGTGTEVVSDQAITANQWFRIDMYRTSTTVDWRIDYNAELTDTTGAVVQTQATGSGGTSVAYRVGWTTSSTATMHSDDAASSVEQGHYPIGDVRVLPLKVDSAGTVTVSGSTSNFGVMTNNGTVGAWNATNARNAVDDVPPDLSGTRDGTVCVTASASDYVEFPMETLDMAASKVNVRAVRWIACLWAASATTATIRFRIFDGTSEVSGAGLSEQDPGADNTGTPAWVCGMVKPLTSRIDWTQAKIDALTFRMGSNDATPDIGIDMVVFELAVVKAQEEVLFGESPDIYVTASRDPDTNGLVGFTMNIPSGQQATVDYTVNGTPTSTGLKTSSDSPFYQAISSGGTDLPTVTDIVLKPG